MYIKVSLETHLFFARIMKEHAFFLQAAFPSGETGYIKEADWYREQFEKQLEEIVRLANGNVGANVLNSGEIVTEYTETAERQTERLAGIPINIQITRAEKRLHTDMKQQDKETMQKVRRINRKVMDLLTGLVSFKEKILQNVLSCNLYTFNYPLLIEHITREARLYLQTIREIEQGRIPNNNRKNMEMFWNQIMMEHAEFIRGLLDPTEKELIETANGYAEEYEELLAMARQQEMQPEETLMQETFETTQRYRDFKATGANGIINCNIRSVILPLLADHVLREANHYLRLLKFERN